MSPNLERLLRNEVIPRLVTEFQPEAIYLFGSYAWGKPGAESDLDVMVVVNQSQQTPAQRAARAQRSLRGLRMAEGLAGVSRSAP